MFQANRQYAQRIPAQYFQSINCLIIKSQEKWSQSILQMNFTNFLAIFNKYQYIFQMKLQLLLILCCLLGKTVCETEDTNLEFQRQKYDSGQETDCCYGAQGIRCDCQQQQHVEVHMWQVMLDQQQHQDYHQDKESRKNLDRLLSNNKEWAAQMVEKNPQFFNELVNIQTPEYLWIGCSDSRVPANQITKLAPGSIFVHRNVANIVLPSDINALAVIQYAVQYLKVKDIMVVGHYGCGGVKASFIKHDHGPLESWLAQLRDLRGRYRNYLNRSTKQNEDLLVQLNIKTQVYNVARIPVVQQAWSEGRQLRIHGLVYDLKDGILKDLGINIDSIKQLPKQYVIIQ